MKEEIVSFEVAKLAKEVGFILTEESKPIFEIYYEDGKLHYDSEGYCSNHSDVIYAPTQSLLQKWLREVHRIYIVVHIPKFSVSILTEKETIKIEKGDYTLDDYQLEKVYNSYEEALEAGLLEALDIIIKYESNNN